MEDLLARVYGVLLALHCPEDLEPPTWEEVERLLDELQDCINDPRRTD